VSIVRGRKIIQAGSHLAAGRQQCGWLAAAMPAGAVAARRAEVLTAPGRGEAGVSMRTRNASNTSPRPTRRKVSPKKATPMAAAAKTRQPKKACTTKTVKPPPLFLVPGQVELLYVDGAAKTEIYPKIGDWRPLPACLLILLIPAAAALRTGTAVRSAPTGTAR
jgi:hypothetical protein